MKSDGKWKERYQQAHFKYYEENFPNVVKDGLYTEPKYPVVSKANGLTAMVENFLNWSGYRATRVNVMGRVVEGSETTASGATFAKKKYMKSTTRRGSADISSTIKGKSVMWEIKIGTDRPSEHQLKEQAKERKAGGEYFFIKTPEQFFEEYDRIVNSFLYL